MTPEQRALGAANFHRVVGKLAGADEVPTASRRDFMKGLIGFGAALPLTAAAYFGYQQWGRPTKPIKAGLIGAGDEGGVLVSDHNPEFTEIVAYSDIRPYNQKRIFNGEGVASRRRGLIYHYGSDAPKNIKLYEDYKEMLKRDDIELVIIALPLYLHYQATMDALNAGKHVLCEKLMARNIKQCKEMIALAKQKDLLLSIGHQRHYSMLYAHCVEVLKSGVCGDVRHIRALWHRNNTQRPGEEKVDGKTYLRYGNDGWRPLIRPEDEAKLGNIDLSKYGWDNLNQLVRWRLFNKTGGGLMAELGSHQLDACSIFIKQALGRTGDTYPIAVSGIGGKHFYNDDREVEDHVYCTFEFPGKNYDPNIKLFDHQKQVYNHNDIVTVTYSSVSTNAFENYGECVMGSQGTLIVEREQAAYLYGLAGRGTEVTAVTRRGGAALDASSSVPPTDAPKEIRAADAGAASIGPKISYGYREEIEHLSVCIDKRKGASSADKEKLVPRCDGKVAMADAVIAFTANLSMRHQRRIEFQKDWFDPEKMDATPEKWVEDNIK
jgi:predicted dehydrogenase